MTTQRERFLARFRRLRKEGLVDLKLFLRGTLSPTERIDPEEVFEELNSIHDQIDRGEVEAVREVEPGLQQRNIVDMLQRA